MKIAFLGLGSMGGGMARNLITQGHSRDRLEPESGGPPKHSKRKARGSRRARRKRRGAPRSRSPCLPTTRRSNP